MIWFRDRQHLPHCLEIRLLKLNKVEKTEEYFGLFDGESFCCKFFSDSGGYQHGYFKGSRKQNVSRKDFQTLILAIESFKKDMLTKEYVEIIRS